MTNKEQELKQEILVLAGKPLSRMLEEKVAELMRGSINHDSWNKNQSFIKKYLKGEYNIIWTKVVLVGGVMEEVFLHFEPDFDKGAADREENKFIIGDLLGDAMERSTKTTVIT